jgi:hypothetical protein
MVQRFPELQGIDPSIATAVVQIQLIHVITFNQKAHNPAMILIQLDLDYLCPVAQEKRPTEKVRGLQGTPHQILISFVSRRSQSEDGSCPPPAGSLG